VLPDGRSIKPSLFLRRKNMLNNAMRAGLGLVLTASLTAAVFGGGPDPTPAAPKEQHALDLLKGMSDKLAGARSIRFRARDSIEAPGGTGQFLNFFADTEVAAVRPDKLTAKVRGDAPPFDLYFDGAEMAVYEPTAKLYASAEAPKTLDGFLPFAAKHAGLILPFADVLYADPYAVMTRDLTSAFYAGSSRINGAECEHLAFAAPGIEWQLWVDAETSLPCLLTGALLDVRGAPRFSVEFSDWELNAPAKPQDFSLARPSDADLMDFRALTAH
jgi:hypothetical protein